ncbi:MAG: signal transduction histidine kinase, partial [Planctomycetota bacterium]
EATSRSRSQALTHGVSIELELPDDLELLDDPSWGDPELISSAVENLIRNAIRFSPGGSSVHVSLSTPEVTEVAVIEALTAAEVRKASERAKKRKNAGLGANGEGPERIPNRHVYMQVRDEGPGMPEELIATVFEPFQQAASERHGNRGTGLGLAIAHKVCTLHKGSIRAFNRVDGISGCVVEIRLPFLEEADWAADRPITAALTKGGIGEGIRDSRLGD